MGAQPRGVQALPDGGPGGRLRRGGRGEGAREPGLDGGVEALEGHGLGRAKQLAVDAGKRCPFMANSFRAISASNAAARGASSLTACAWVAGRSAARSPPSTCAGSNAGSPKLHAHGEQWQRAHGAPRTALRLQESCFACASAQARPAPIVLTTSQAPPCRGSSDSSGRGRAARRPGTRGRRCAFHECEFNAPRSCRFSLAHGNTETIHETAFLRHTLLHELHSTAHQRLRLLFSPPRCEADRIRVARRRTAGPILAAGRRSWRRSRHPPAVQRPSVATGGAHGVSTRTTGRPGSAARQSSGHAGSAGQPRFRQRVGSAGDIAGWPPAARGAGPLQHVGRAGSARRRRPLACCVEARDDCP